MVDPEPDAPSATPVSRTRKVPAAKAPVARTPTTRRVVKDAPETAPKASPSAAPADAAEDAAAVKPAPAPKTPVRKAPVRKAPVRRTPSTASKAPAVSKAGKTPAVSKARKAPAVSTAPKSKPLGEVVLSIEGLVKRFGDTVAVAGIDLSVRAGSLYGVVGPNGAGKTTTLSMVTGLLRPDAGKVVIHGVDVWANPVEAKRKIGVLPDRLRLFDRLTGAQLLYYSGTLRGLDRVTVEKRTADLATAFGFDDALDRLVTDYSAGMSKKIALAAAMIHSPRVLVLDEPFESVDPVSAANVTQILRTYVDAGGTVVLSSHSMDLIQRICDTVAVVVNGAILDSGPMDEVRRGKTLEERFVELAGGRTNAEGMEWLHNFSD